MRLSLIEATFWALMVDCGETYFVACAVRLGATPLQLGLTVGLPLAVGAVGPALALWLLARHRQRRPLVALASAIQAASLVALTGADLVGSLDPSLLIAIACLYQTCALAGSTAWRLAYFSVMLTSTYGRTRPQAFAAQNALNGSAQLLGGLLGAWLVGRVGGDYRVVFAISTVTRLALAAGAPAWLPRVSPDDAIGRRALLLRVVGFRPHGGLVHRPLPPDDEPMGEPPSNLR
ncbi:MAG TPA: hypothetical protein VMV46_08665 [Thermoanaerobaculia bacterium]|nr:hypothetical protein [Thermoanaerobaculia bacterium]